MAWVHQAMSVLKLHTMATAIMTKKVTTPNTARSTMSFAVRRPEAARVLRSSSLPLSLP